MCGRFHMNEFPSVGVYKSGCVDNIMDVHLLKLSNLRCLRGYIDGETV